ncbi:MAG: carboxypeptidase regulatory-like domain-containing protein [Acidobacteriota bacterium]|nr:carboxypeptidase regulatory-like domain-containing protein [Acidobacteriota bacterium]
MFTRSLQALILLISGLAGFSSASTITGKVVEDHSGAGLASAGIHVVRTGSGETIADLETESNGSFEVPELPAGEYRIEVSKPNYVGATLPLRVGGEVSGSFVARLIRCGVITGHVLDSEGQPVHGATLFATSRPSEGGALRPFARFERGHEAQVDGNGEYRLFNLPPGQYAVAVTYGASTVVVGGTGGAQAGATGSGVLYYPASSQPQLFTVSGSEEYRGIDFSIVPGALYRVTGKVDVSPPQSGFWLALTSVNQPAFATAVAQAGEDGTFHFEGIPPGSYTVFASGPSHSRGPLGFMPDKGALFGRTQVEVGGDVDGVAVAVGKARSASFVLRNSVPGDHVCSFNMELQISSLEDWAADLDRTVKVGFTKPERSDQLAPGRYLLTLRDSGADCYSAGDSVLDLTAARDERPLAIPVAPKGSIHGRLLGDKRQAANFAIVLLPAVAAGAEQPVTVAFADSEARFTFERLRPGRYRIAARPSTDQSSGRWIPDLSRMREIEVKPATATDLELPVPDGNPASKE